MGTQMYLNLAVKDLDKSIGFFTKMGFKFNPQFTDNNATCMIIGEDIYVMLLVEKFFQTFIKKEICDAKRCTEAIIGLTVDSREKVDELVKTAVDAGGSTYSLPQDHGWMYGHGFADLDGHLWEIFHMDMSKFPGN